MAEGLMIVPGGYRDRTQVRLIEPGSTVDAGGDLSPLIAKANRAGRLSSEFSIRPHLRGASNWISAAWWLNTTKAPITYFRMEWRVPRAPVTQTSQLIYLFNGMQPARTSPFQTILQPVLEWGQIGQCWSVASWIVPDSTGHTGYTSHVGVNPGDVLIGVIRLIDQTGDLFAYSCEFEGIDDTRFSVINMPELVWCVATLEAYEPGGAPPYDLNLSSEYPKTKRTAFRQIKVETGAKISSLNWVPTDYVKTYGEHTKVVNSSSTKGRVDIFYGAETGTSCTKEG